MNKSEIMSKMHALNTIYTEKCSAIGSLCVQKTEIDKNLKVIMQEIAEMKSQAEQLEKLFAELQEKEASAPAPAPESPQESPKTPEEVSLNETIGETQEAKNG